MSESKIPEALSTPENIKNEIDNIISMYKELSEDFVRTGKELLKNNASEPVMISIALTCLDYLHHLPKGAVDAARMMHEKLGTSP